jgi:hypothetical protein
VLWRRPNRACHLRIPSLLAQQLLQSHLHVNQAERLRGLTSFYPTSSVPVSLTRTNMSLQSAADVPLLISSSNSSSERRISPSWSIAHLKSRLEPITGVPASSQQLSLRVGSQDAVPITGLDEEQTRLAEFPLQPYAEITVSASFAILPISAVSALRP